MKKHLASWWIPVASFLAAGILAVTAGPSLGFTSRMMMDYTGKRYVCWRNCYETGSPGLESKIFETDMTGIDGWTCVSIAPVTFFTSENAYSDQDFAVKGVGKWGVTRFYVSEPTFADGAIGPCWRIGEFCRLIRRGSQIWLIEGNNPVASFDDNGNGTYTPQFNYTASLTTDAVNHQLVLTDPSGRRGLFFDFSGFWSGARQGRLKQLDDAGGNITTLLYSATAGPTLDKVLEVQQTDTNPALLHRFLLNYNLSGATIGLLASINYVQSVSGVSTTVRNFTYAYYTSTGPNGPVGALQRVRVTDAASAVLETFYYRYNAMDGTGWVPLRYAVRPTSYDRMLAALGSDAAIDAAADATIAPYADFFFQYGANRILTSETVQGKGCGCGTSSGRGTFTYSLVEAVNVPDGPNVWRRKNTMTFPDGNQLIMYMNGFGQPMLEVYKEVATGTQWRKYRQFNADGSLAAVAYPSAVTGHDEALPGLVSSAHLPDATGLWHLYEYYATTNLPAGAVAKYGSASRLRQGEIGTPILQETHLYTSRTGSVATVFPLSSDIVYRNTNGTGAQTTSFSYTWQGTTTQILQKTTGYPAVTAAQNGPGSATSTTVQFDAFNRRTWVRDEDGYIQALEYDPLTGTCTKRIGDVDTALVANEPAGWVTPAGGGLQLVTTRQVDALGRTTKLTDPIGNITYLVYRDPQHEVRRYPGWIAATNTTTGPTVLVRHDRTRSYKERLAMSAPPAVVSGVPTGTEAVSGLQSLSRDYLDNGDRVVTTDGYFNFSGLTYSTAVNIGTLGTHYHRRTFNYDVKGRRDRDQDWAGTITRSVYDTRDRVVSTWIGTDDIPTAGDWSPANTAGTNLVKVTTHQYDSGGVGDGNRTKSSLFTSASVSLDTVSQYDFRDRLLQVRGPDKVTTQNTYDNLNQVTMTQSYADANSNFVIEAAELRARSQSSYDERGRLFRDVVFNVDPTTGAVGNSLTTDSWSNGRGLVVKMRGANSDFTKSSYDGVGREKASFIAFDDAETLFADAMTVVNDKVVEQNVSAYDANGNVIQMTSYRRTGSTAKTGDLSVTWAAADSRRMFTAQWFDAADRLTSVVDYGTNGNVALVRPATPPLPNTSSAYLVTKYGYDAGGRQSQQTDNLNRLTQRTFDGLSRMTQVIENYVTGTPTETSLDTDRKATIQYDSSGRLSKRIAFNPKGTGLGVQQQTTTYVYGTIANQAAPAVFRNDLLAAELFPDSDDTYNPASAPGSQLGNGADAVYDRMEITYDYAGRRKTVKDQRGTIRTLNYDAQGRLFSDAVTTLSAGVDGAVRRKEYGYDSISRIRTSTSFDTASAGAVVNQVAYTHDGWASMIKREEAHVGSVVAGTPSTQVGVADGAVSGVAKFIRPVSMTFPNGRVLFMNYPAAGSIGDRLSRIDNLANDAAGTAKFAAYTYLGSETILDIDHPLVTNGFTFRQGPENAPGGWDQFDRQTFTKWRNTANTFTHDQHNYSYDRASNRLTRQRASTTAPATPKDEFYTYDGLNRLTKQNRGLLAGSPLTITDASANFSQRWTALESLGNWRTWDVAPAGGGTYSFAQNRTHNAANEIDTDNNDANAAGAAITGSGGGDWIDPTFDKQGNLRSGPKVGAETTRQWFTYDAWNRLVKVQADNAGAPGTTVAEYGYDAEDQRIVKLIPNGANWNRTDYYGMNSQCVEERTLINSVSKTTVATVPKFQWVWDLRYLDAVVLRDENKDGDAVCTGAADQRNFYGQDVNFNTSVLVNTAGSVVERYVYDAYGKATVLNGSWASQAATVFNNEILYAGYRLDPETGLYAVRKREYHPTLGRWLQRDPIEYGGGTNNLYEYVGGNPIHRIDPQGTDFIAVGTRYVRTLGLRLAGGHMSIEFWKECEPKNEDGQHFKNRPREDAERDVPRSFQLLNSSYTPDGDEGMYYTWKWVVGGQGKYGGPGRWYWFSQTVSVVWPTSEAIRRVIIYSDATDSESDLMWESIIDPNAKSYPWAEQGPKPPHPAQKWPNSIYQPTGNNCNTFIRYLAHAIGKDANIIGGKHYGNESPQPIGPADIWNLAPTPPTSYNNPPPAPNGPPTPP